jgi:hypothetical protein
VNWEDWEETVIPRKQSDSLKDRVGWSWADFLMYVAHFELVAEGVNISNPDNEGGCRFLSSHGSCNMIIK